MKAIYDDVCDMCGDFVDDASAALFLVEPLSEWNAARISLYRLVHRACLGDHSEAPHLDDLGKEPLPDIARTGALHRITQSQPLFGEAQARKDYALVAQLLRQALPDVLPGMLEMSTDFGRVEAAAFPISGPYVAAAALCPDETVDDLFEEIAASPLSGGAVAPGAVVAMRNSMMRIGTALSATAPRPMDRKSLRAAAGGSDGRLFARSLDYLVKAGRVFANVNGYALTADVEQVEKPRPKSAQSDRAAVEPQLINLARLPRVLGPDTYSFPHRRDDEPAPTAHTISVTDWARTPYDLRPAGKARVGVTASTTWLFTYSYTPSKVQAHAATIVDRNGATTRRIELSARPRRWVATPDRDWVTILDDNLNLWVYRDDGELRDSIDLRTAPEVATALNHPGAYAWQLRSADHDIRTKRTLFSFDDAVWCLEPDGDIAWGWRTPQKPYPSGAWRAGSTPPQVQRIAADLDLRADLTAREAAALLHESQQANEHVPRPGRKAVATQSAVTQIGNHLGVLTPDRIEAATFLNRGAIVSTSYGLNVEIGPDGDLDRLWNSPGTFHPLGRIDGATLGYTRGNFLKVMDTTLIRSGERAPVPFGTEQSTDADPTVPVMLTSGELVAGNGWIVSVSDKAIAIAAEGDWTPTTYKLPSAARAVVVLSDALRVHTNTTHALIPLPCTSPELRRRA